MFGIAGEGDVCLLYRLFKVHYAFQRMTATKVEQVQRPPILSPRLRPNRRLSDVKEPLHVRDFDRRVPA